MRVDGMPLLVPSVAGAMLGVDRFTPNADYRYVAGLCAALMAGWTALLIWADRDPVARRGILLLTVCPVVLGTNFLCAVRSHCAVPSRVPARSHASG
jgi:hypothetical protein